MIYGIWQRGLGWLCHLLVASGLATAVVFAAGLDVPMLGLPVLLLAAAAFVAGLGLAAGGSLPRVGKVSTALVLLAVGYLGWRMAVSPVQDLARHDFLLLAGALSLWAVLRGSPPEWRVERTAWIVLAVALVAQALVAAYQYWVEPEFTPVYASRPRGEFGSGFYALYNDLAAFLAGLAMPVFALIAWPGVRRGVRLAALLFALLALLGLFASQSRGGFVALGVGLAVLALFWILLPQTTPGKRLLAVLILIPVLLAGGGALVQGFLHDRQVEGVESMVEYNDRLFYAAMAAGQIAEKPWLGSGSQSYSYRHVEHWSEDEWKNLADPRWVHNEYLQAATDYGLIGLLVILAALGAVWVRGGLTAPAEGENATSQALRAGALAGMAALGGAALFSFVFHLLPTLLLLVVLAAAALPRVTADPRSRWRWGGAAALVACAILAAPVAVQEARAWWVGLEFWTRSQADERIAALREMVRVRPSFPTYRDLGLAALAQVERETDERVQKSLLEEAERAFGVALERHPYKPELLVNRANALDSLGRFEEAESLHRRLAETLGGRREWWWRGHYYRGRHYHLWGRQVWGERRPEEALWLLHRAREEFERSRGLVHIRENSPLYPLIQENADTIRFLENAGVEPREPE